MAQLIRQEMQHTSLNGYFAFIAGALGVLAGAWLFHASTLGAASNGAGFFGIFLVLAGLFVCKGVYMLQPNETAVLTLFGRYVGTDRGEGLRWAFPLYRKRKLTVRARNLNMSTLKVNDKRGNPVELAAAVVWRVRDTAQALFEVDDFERYVSVQAEAALRHLASQYAYDEGEDLAPGELTLRGGAHDLGLALSNELTARFEAAGVETLDEADAPGVCAGDRPGDAAPPAGPGDHQRPRPDRPRCCHDGRGCAEGPGRARNRRTGCRT